MSNEQQKQPDQPQQEQDSIPLKDTEPYKLPKLTYLDEDEIDRAQTYMKQKDYEEAKSVYSSLLEKRVPMFGEFAVECSDLYYKYGLALLRMAQERSEEIVASRIEKVKEMKQNDAIIQPQVVASSSEPVEQEEQKEETSNLPVEETGEELLESAYQNLELARIIFARQLEKSSSQAEMRMWAKKLADTHLSLGEVACENDAFSQAVIEYNNAAQLVTFDHQILSEAYTCLAAAYMLQQHKIKEAIHSYEQSIVHLSQHIEENAKNMDSDRKVVEEMRSRIEELKLEEQEQQAKMQMIEKEIRQQFSQSLAAMTGNSSSVASSQQINILVPRRKDVSAQQPSQEQPGAEQSNKREREDGDQDSQNKKPKL